MPGNDLPKASFAFNELAVSKIPSWGDEPVGFLWQVRNFFEVWSHGMPNKVIPFPSGNTAKTETVFIRERLILNVASIRYEMELIGIFTPLSPKRVRQPKRPAVSTAERKRPQPPPDGSNPSIAAEEA